jgi:hypothetical protein
MRTYNRESAICCAQEVQKHDHQEEHAQAEQHEPPVPERTHAASHLRTPRGLACWLLYKTLGEL